MLIKIVLFGRSETPLGQHVFMGVSMFVELTKTDNTKKIYNTEYIRSIHKENNHTVIELQYGTDLVKERPDEIIEMLKGGV